MASEELMTTTYMMSGMMPRRAPGKPNDVYSFIRPSPAEDADSSERMVRARMASVLELIKTAQDTTEEEDTDDGVTELPDSPILRSETFDGIKRMSSRDFTASLEDRKRAELERTVKMLQTIRQLEEQLISSRGIRRGSGSLDSYLAYPTN